MWNLPRSGIEPVSPALAGRFFPAEPPGKLWRVFSTIIGTVPCLIIRGLWAGTKMEDYKWLIWYRSWLCLHKAKSSQQHHRTLPWLMWLWDMLHLVDFLACLPLLPSSRPFPPGREQAGGAEGANIGALPFLPGYPSASTWCWLWHLGGWTGDHLWAVEMISF